MSTEDQLLAEIEVCGAEADSCICFLAPHPDTQVHRCRIWASDRRCGAAWFGDWGDDTFIPVIFPGGEPA